MKCICPVFTCRVQHCASSEFTCVVQSNAQCTCPVFTCAVCNAVPSVAQCPVFTCAVPSALAQCKAVPSALAQCNAVPSALAQGPASSVTASRLCIRAAALPSCVHPANCPTFAPPLFDAHNRILYAIVCPFLANFCRSEHWAIHMYSPCRRVCTLPVARLVHNNCAPARFDAYLCQSICVHILGESNLRI